MFEQPKVRMFYQTNSWAQKISFFDWSISARDIMNGKKTKDFYYLQLQKLANFDESTDLDSINQCIKSARVSDD